MIGNAIITKTPTDIPKSNIACCLLSDWRISITANPTANNGAHNNATPYAYNDNPKDAAVSIYQPTILSPDSVFSRQRDAPSIDNMIKNGSILLSSAQREIIRCHGFIASIHVRTNANLLSRTRSPIQAAATNDNEPNKAASNRVENTFNPKIATMGIDK